MVLGVGVERGVDSRRRRRSSIVSSHVVHIAKTCPGFVEIDDNNCFNTSSMRLRFKSIAASRAGLMSRCSYALFRRPFFAKFKILSSFI